MGVGTAKVFLLSLGLLVISELEMSFIVLVVGALGMRMPRFVSVECSSDSIRLSFLLKNKSN